jgi:Na+/melibiose symporter-like transporter
MALKNSEVVRYSLYGPFAAIGLALPMSYFTMFQTEGLGWTAALATTVLIIPRIIDFIGGVICGSVIAKTNMKWGKYRSWLVVGGWVVMAGVIMMFFNSRALPLPGQIAVSATGYVFQNFPMNFILTSQYGVMMLMGGASMNDRVKLSVTNLRFQMFGTLATSAGLVPALRALTRIYGPNPDNPNWYHPNAYMTMAVITGAMFLIGTYSIASASKEYDKPNAGVGSRGPALGFGDILKGVFSNDQLLVYTLVNTLNSIALFAALPLALFYYMYILQNMMLQPVQMTISTLFGVVAAMVGPMLGKKVGKKRALQLGFSIAVTDSVLIAFLAGNTNVLTGGIQIGFIIYIVLMCLTAIGRNIWFGFGGNYYVDAGEYGYWKTGKDNRAVSLGLGAIPAKVSLIVAGALSGYALHAIGYRPGMGRPGGPPLPLNFNQNFMLLLGLLPASVYLLGLLIFSFGWKITDADAAKYAKENLERTQAQSKAASEGGGASG